MSNILRPAQGQPISTSSSECTLHINSRVGSRIMRSSEAKNEVFRLLEDWAARLGGWVIALCLVAPLSAEAIILPSLGEAANFVVLGLANGDVSINSATSITGNVGYSAGVN